MRLMMILAVVAGAAAWARPTGDEVAIERCLKNWGKHPFGKGPHEFKVISPGVKVLGIGRDISDEEKTEKPQLVLVKPSVNVLTGNRYRFSNPNGWYCLKANVTVLGKSEFELPCDAKIIGASDDDVTIAGSNRTDQGVTVLGKTKITRLGCPKEKGT